MRKLIATVLPAALFAAPLALAAPQPMPAQAPASSTTAVHVDSATLHTFAKAYEDAQQVKMKYMGRVATAKTKDQKDAIEQQAVKEMKQHVSRYMPVSRYIAVGDTINSNPDLRKQLIAILQADQKKSTPASPGSGN